MKTRERLAATLWGVAAGVFGGLFGVGGGIVLVPLLTSVFHLSQHRAHGTSLAVIGATAAAGLIGYGSHGRVAWGVAALAGGASMATAWLGAKIASRLSSKHLRISFTIFIALVGLRLIFKGAEGPAPQSPEPVIRALEALGIGAATGILAGLMGVGGGILAVPAFALLLGMEQHAAQGTSLAVILLTAPVGALTHARHGNLEGRVVLWLALGSAVGGALASLLVQGAPAPLLTRAFGGLLIVTAVQNIIRLLRSPSSGR